MAQDSSAPNTAPVKPEEVDIDELEVEVFIVCKNENNLKQTCAFLTRRGWPSRAMSNITQAVEYIAEKRPDFVLISFNHANPAILKLPDLITQTFNLECIGFVESGEASGMQRLNQSKMRHKIQSSASGPTIHRTIRRLLAEKFNVGGEEKAATAEDAGSESDKNITVRGGGDGDPSIVQKGASQKIGGPGMGARAREAVDNHVNVGGGYTPQNSHASATSRSEKGLAYMPTAGGANGADAAASGPAHMPYANSGASGSGQGMSGLMGGGAPAGNLVPTGNYGGIKNEKPGGVANTGHAEQTMPGLGGAAAGLGESPDGDAANPDVISNGKYKIRKPRRRSLKELSKDGPAGEEPGHKGESSATPNAQDAKASADLLGDIKKSLFGGEAAAAAAAGDSSSAESTGPADEEIPQTALERATNAALAAICREDASMTPMFLSEVSKIGVFPIDSLSLPGYLVLALTNLPEHDQKPFMEAAEKGLRDAFVSMGVQAKLENGFWVDLPQVSFLSWADAASLFNFTVSHQGAEIGAAFFQAGQPLPKPRANSDKGMFTLRVEHISTDHPVTFKVYLYLKQNQKYFLYLRNGRRLQPEQKQRLLEGKHSDVYMKSVDVENLRSFLAGVFLNGTIKSPAGGEAA